ncbi:MAG: glycosyltransferase family 2 protein [Cognatishimia sp.]
MTLDYQENWLNAYRMRLKRRRLLWRSLRSRKQLAVVADRTSNIAHTSVLAVTTLRNEMMRLPFFLEFYRNLGVDHFLIVDNGSDDGSDTYLAAQEDVSLWQTEQSYHGSRFGVDWMTYLQMRYAHNHWCLTVDADELLVYSGDDHCDLKGLTALLDQQGLIAFGALMLDLYPKGALGQQDYKPGDDPRDILDWFDAGPFRSQRQYPLGNLWVQGGVRERMFFADAPQRSPTLNKLPLVKWNRRFAYVNSSHSILPPKINFAYNGPGGITPSGALLHTKFLPEIVSKSETEKQRKEHFNVPEDFDGYYDGIIKSPQLWSVSSIQYEDPSQLVQLGLISSEDWGLRADAR